LSSLATRCVFQHIGYFLGTTVANFMNDDLSVIGPV
jgi:hypothetical protein